MGTGALLQKRSVAPIRQGQCATYRSVGLCIVAIVHKMVQVLEEAAFRDTAEPLLFNAALLR
jgi:hypothetical protein